MQVNKKIIQRVKIETVQAKITLDLSPCQECSSSLNFYLDCPFSEGNIVNPEICSEQCNVRCEALIYCDHCDFEEFIELFPKTGMPIQNRLEEKDTI